MLAEKNENIKTAYEILERASKSKEARMVYEARQAEIMDQMTREKTAQEKGREEGMQKGIQKGREEGIQQGMEKTAVAALKEGMAIDLVAKITGLSIEKINELNNEIIH